MFNRKFFTISYLFTTNWEIVHVTGYSELFLSHFLTNWETFIIGNSLISEKVNGKQNHCNTKWYPNFLLSSQNSILLLKECCRRSSMIWIIPTPSADQVVHYRYHSRKSWKGDQEKYDSKAIICLFLHKFCMKFLRHGNCIKIVKSKLTFSAVKIFEQKKVLYFL